MKIVLKSAKKKPIQPAIIRTAQRVWRWTVCAHAHSSGGNEAKGSAFQQSCRLNGCWSW